MGKDKVEEILKEYRNTTELNKGIGLFKAHTALNALYAQKYERARLTVEEIENKIIEMIGIDMGTLGMKYAKEQIESLATAIYKAAREKMAGKYDKM